MFIVTLMGGGENRRATLIQNGRDDVPCTAVVAKFTQIDALPRAEV